MNTRCRTLLATLGACAPLAALADAPAPEGEGTHALWLNPGFYAYHFQKNRNLNNNAEGFGADYRYSPDSAVTAGFYRNGERAWSHYLAWYWRPLALGPVRLGAIVGAVNGYPGTRHGGWFPAVLPTASVEYGRLGLNVLYIPSYQNSVNGSLTLQLKIRVD